MKIKTIRRASLGVCKLVTTLLLLMSLSVSANDSADDNIPDLDNVTGPSLFLKGQKSYYDAPLLETSVDIAITGMISKVVVTQTFENTSSEWVEGKYVFPLADQAAVNSLKVRIGDREIVGSIKEKKQAEKQYEIAKQAGQLASLVKQHRPNLFSSRFANVPPGEKISIELGYIQSVKYESDQYSLRVPLTLTPRYSNALVVDTAKITPPQVSLSASSPSEINHRVQINTYIIGLYEATQVSSPSHELSVTNDNDGVVLSLQDESYLDRDFILHWSDAANAAPLVRAWRENLAGEEYLLATIMPPIDDSEIPDQSRELILVVDTSGSMAGESMRAAIAAVRDALDGLQAQDKFNIIEFDSVYSTLFSKPQPATEENLARASEFAQRLIADGGTEMLEPLKAALRYKKSTEMLRQVVFITDGAIGYEESVFKSVTRNLGDSRLFTVGIGSAPNQWFMRKVAEAGRGTHHLIHNINDVQEGMSRLLRKLESPALTSIQVAFDGAKADITPDPIPDLYANEPIVIAAKLADDNHTMSVVGKWGDIEWRTSLSVDNAPLAKTGLSTVWAKQKIEALQDKQRFHSDQDFYKSLILRLSLDHQILSPYTAFLAVEETPIRPGTEKLAQKDVPNLLPAGSDMQSVSLPQGSTGIDTLLLLSLILLFMAVVLFEQPMQYIKTSIR